MKLTLAIFLILTAVVSVLPAADVPVPDIDGLANALNTVDGSEFRDYSAPYFLDEASTQQRFGNATMVAEKLVGPNAKDRVLKEMVSDGGPPNGETGAAAIETAFRKALGRGPAEERVLKCKP